MPGQSDNRGDPGEVVAETQASRYRHSARSGHRDPLTAPSGTWLTTLAYFAVAVPFLVAIVRLLMAPSAHLTLPDDLALIDLHARRALAWKQQLGVFDHNNWNHPGPTYFYWLSLIYRALGPGARALFVGATLLNGLSAAGCVAVVRRRTTPGRALWSAVWICVLGIVLAAAGPGSTTYSESVLGALVSPWNPTVILFPLLLLVLLCAGAIDRSGLSLLGALLVGSFVIQTDISTLPLVAGLSVASTIVWLVSGIRTRRTKGHDRHGRNLWGIGLAIAGAVGLVLVWLPPVIQQLTNNPGNLTLIWRFFATTHPSQSLTGTLWSVAAAAGVVVTGPGAVMLSILGGTPADAALVFTVSVVTVAVAIVTVVLGTRVRARFAVGIGILVLVGSVTSVVAVTHVVGFVFGYLVLWVVILPVSALIGIGMMRFRLPGVSGVAVRNTLAVVTVVAGVVFTVRVLAIPSLTEASDPDVGHLASLVQPLLVSGGRVLVGDAGAGTKDTQLLDTERFIGLVNVLDQHGYRPTVNAFWKAQFGPGYLSDGLEGRIVSLSTWTHASPGTVGYVGRVGDMAVVVTVRVSG